MNRQLIGDAWYEMVKDEFEKDYFVNLREELKKEYMENRCYPAPHDIFKVYQLCKPEDVRVVMLSQDPYPSQHAHGIAFSSLQNDTPYSLQIILREVDRDVIRTKNRTEFKQAFPTNSLINWVKQGVFPINVNLTVRSGSPMSHNHLGWQLFTKRVLEVLIVNTTPKVFITLGAEAVRTLLGVLVPLQIDESTNHYIIETGHPASGAHGKDKFSGCSFASKTNRYFESKGLPGIDWKLNAV